MYTFTDKFTFKQRNGKTKLHFEKPNNITHPGVANLKFVARIMLRK